MGATMLPEVRRFLLIPGPENLSRYCVPHLLFTLSLSDRSDKDKC